MPAYPTTNRPSYQIDPSDQSIEDTLEAKASLNLNGGPKENGQATKETVASVGCEEYDKLRDYVDILENCLPAGESYPEQIGKITVWREKLELLGKRELDGSNQAYDSMMSVADDLFRWAHQWPEVTEHHPPQAASTLEMMDAKQEMQAEIASLLSAYSAQRYMATLDSFMPPDAATAQFISRQLGFAFDTDSPEVEAQEAFAMFRHTLADHTEEHAARPGVREVFDAANVTIERNWTSSTELTTTITYDGEKLAEIDDIAKHHPLGHYMPSMTDKEAVAAARDTFYHGNDLTAVAPLNESSVDAMQLQMMNDLAEAKNSFSESPDKVATFNEMEAFIGSHFHKYAPMEDAAPTTPSVGPESSL